MKLETSVAELHVFAESDFLNNLYKGVDMHMITGHDMKDRIRAVTVKRREIEIGI